MKLRETFQLAWENRHQIAEGLYNKYIESTEEIKDEATRRKHICETNGTCGHYDAEGKDETSVQPGKPACNKCHCNIDLKTMCMSCYCSLGDIEPGDRKAMDKALWIEVITPEMDNDINQKGWEQQFKPKQ